MKPPIKMLMVYVDETDVYRTGPLYEAMLGGWMRVERAAMADGALPRTEVLWLNRAAAESCPQGTLL